MCSLHIVHTVFHLGVLWSGFLGLAKKVLVLKSHNLSTACFDKRYLFHGCVILGGISACDFVALSA